MQTYILQENVLTDNILILCDENEILNDKYVAIIKEYSYATPWSDKETIKRFNKRETLFKYLNKNYPNVEIYN